MTEKETIKDGLVETFHKNGQLKYRGNFNNGKPDGLWETFDSIGNLMETKEYKDGELVE